jgi:trehalose synthase
MTRATALALLSHAGLTASDGSDTPPTFMREDGSLSRADHKAQILRVGPAPRPEIPLVVQVSRWDAMKDPIGVLHGFCKLVAPVAPRAAELVLAGPSVSSVADDPEGARVFGELERAYLALPAEQRRAVHLAQLPMVDAEENAALVNALQRHATVIVQKSLVEGFGLTVTEALWKRRPVVASAVGGILEQIRDGVDGLLVRDPHDLTEFAGLLRRVLEDEGLATRLGESGGDRVRDHYLSIAALETWAGLLEQLIEHRAARA